MKIKLICFYPAMPGKDIYIVQVDKKAGNDNMPLSLTYTNNNLWETEIEINTSTGSTFNYSYFIIEDETDSINYDVKGTRSIKINPKRFSHSIIKDYFEDNANEKRLWESSIFSDILFNRSKVESHRFRFPTSGRNIMGSGLWRAFCSGH